jgi:hypothetical protein
MRHLFVRSVLGAALGVVLTGMFSCAPGEPIEGNLSPQPPLSGIQLDPDTVTIDADGTVSFTTTLLYSDGSSQPTASVLYSVSGGGTITDAGRFQAGHSPGTFQVIARSLGFTDTSTVVIAGTEANLVRLSIDPGSAALVPGATQRFATNGIFSDSSIVPLTVDYSATGGSVSNSGLYTAGNTPGLFQVIGSLKGGELADTATIEIGQAPANLVRVELTPTTATMVYGQTMEFSAAGRLSDSTLVSLPVTWTATGGAVTANGIYTAGTTAGNYRIIARASNGMADTSSIRITAPTIRSISLTPAVADLQVGQIQQFTVTATLTNGQTQQNPSVTYTFTGGLMTQSGLYTAGLIPGTYQVIAQASNGAADTSTVNISVAVLTALNITPSTATVQAGQTRQFGVTAVLSNGGTQVNPEVGWTTTGGTVSSTGLFTAGSTVGTFQVRASSLVSQLAGTATVTVVAAPPANMYFNSAEAGCGSDSNVLMCDDFEDGDWYSIDFDRAVATGGLLQTDGWGGTIYANPITPANAAVCGNQGVKSNCAATHGATDGSAGGRNMAEHELSQRVDEVYARYYTKALPGYRFGAEKVLTFNMQNGGGIKWGNLHFGCGSGGGASTGELQYQPTAPETRNCQDVMILSTDRWYYIEVHLKLNTVGQSNGILQVWADDCGATGTSCPATPTLRLNISNWRFNRQDNSELIGSLWWENWANPGSVGTRLIDQIKVSKVGPIGPMP